MSAIDLYAAADLYDRVHLGPWKGELEFYQRQAARCGPRVLELACGTGRLTVPLAAGGLTLTGLDLSAAMLARAQSKAAAAGVLVRFVQADMRAFDLGETFDLVFVPVNSLCHLLTRPDLEAFLRCVRAHLAPAGRFVIDVFNPSLTILSRDPSRWYTIGEYPDDQDGHLRLTEQNRYDAAAQVNHIVWRFDWEDGGRAQHRLTMRQFFPQELDALLIYNGFAIEAKYGQYGERDFHAESRQQLVVARAA